jgi:hypothetical protein
MKVKAICIHNHIIHILRDKSKFGLFRVLKKHFLEINSIFKNRS